MSSRKTHALAQLVSAQAGNALVEQLIILAPLSVVLALVLMLTLLRPV